MKKLVRTLCLLIYYTIGVHFPTQPMPTWRIGYAIKRILLKGIAEEVGKDVVVKHQCYIGKGTGLKVGDRSQLGQNARIDQNVIIGCDVVMGPDIVFMTNAHAFEDPTIPVNQQPALPNQPIVVEDDVWIGTRVIIMPGVTIGKGSVIGAGSIVTKDIPPLSIAVGNPAKVLRKRGDRL